MDTQTIWEIMGMHMCDADWFLTDPCNQHPCQKKKKQSRKRRGINGEK